MHAHSFRRPDGNGSYLDCEVPHFRYPIASRVLGSDAIACLMQIRLWDIETLAPLGLMKGHFGSVKSLCIHPSNAGMLVSFYMIKESYQQSSYLYLP